MSPGRIPADRLPHHGLLAGFGAVHGGGLISTARYYGAAVIALAVLALSGLIRSWPGRAAETTAAPAQGIR